MLKRLLSLALLIVSLAMGLLLVGFVSDKWAGDVIAAACYRLAAQMLLLGFGLMGLLGVIGLLTALWQDLRDYFCQDALSIRRLFYLQQCYAQQQSVRLAQIRQIYYRNHRRCLALSKRDDARHYRQLWQAINAELNSLQGTLPDMDFQELQTALWQQRKTANLAALLALRERLLNAEKQHVVV